MSSTDLSSLQALQPLLPLPPLSCGCCGALIRLCPVLSMITDNLLWCCGVQVYALPTSDPGDSLPSVYNCLIEFSGSDAAVSPFPRQFGLWQTGCFLYEPINAHIQPDFDVDGFTSYCVYFKVPFVDYSIVLGVSQSLTLSKIQIFTYLKTSLSPSWRIGHVLVV